MKKNFLGKSVFLHCAQLYVFNQFFCRIPLNELNRRVSHAPAPNRETSNSTLDCMVSKFVVWLVNSFIVMHLNAFLHLQVDHKELKLLKHPGVHHILSAKWNKFGLPLYSVQLIAYCGLVIPLSITVLLPLMYSEDTNGM